MTTNEGKLWGGRFAGGPSPSSRRCPARRTSTGGWRPTTSPAPARTPTALHRAGLLTRRRAGRAARAGSTRWGSGTTPARCSPDPSDEDVHGALERLLLERGRPRRSAAGSGPGAAATTRSPRCSGCSCATTRDDRRPGPRPRRRPRRPGRGAPRRDHARPHAPPARPAGAALPPPARPRLAAAARRRPAPRLGRRAPRTRRTARERWPAPASASTRSAVAARARLRPAPAANSIDGTAARDFVAEFALRHRA